MSNKSVLSVLSDLSVLSVLCVLVDLSVLMTIVFVICQSSSKSHKYLTRVLQILPWWTTYWGLAISCEVNQSSVLSVTHVNIFYHLDFSERGSSKMGSLTQPPTRAELILTCSLSASAYSHIGQIPITTTSKMQGVILRPWFLCVMGVQQQIQMSYTEKYLQLSSQIQLFNFGYCIKLVTGLWMAIASPRSFTKNARSASTMTLHILCSPPLALSRV